MRKILTATIITTITVLSAYAQQFESLKPIGMERQNYTPGFEIYKPTIPLILDRADNVVYELSADCKKQGDTLQSVTINLPDAQYIKSIRLYYSGGHSVLKSRTRSQAITHHFKELGGGERIYLDPAYSVKKAETSDISENLVLEPNQPLVLGRNYFWISIELSSDTPLSAVIRSQITDLTINGKTQSGSNIAESRLGVSVRNAGDDNVHTYRIPGLVTAKDSSLIGVYDARHSTNFDLQENVDIAMSRSTDGGRTWEPMKIIMDMGQWGGLPESQNGIGDPSILVDEVTGRLWCVAVWTHGMGNARAWQASQQGMTPYDETGQMMIAHSDDNGKTWSKPENITSQIKDPSWSFMLQGPGRGITMTDGTLVFPVQFVDSVTMPHASIIYSKDRGQTWHMGTPARSNTTEAQVVEHPKGTVMLNVRDNRGGSRAVLTTTDLGRKWHEHPSSRGALQEPVCMASIIKTIYNGKEVLLFSNPNSTSERRFMTIKASLDGGHTWAEENQILLDNEPSWGYSCLTMIDPETVGILYEGSTAQLVFQSVKLGDIIKNMKPKNK